MPLTTRAFDLAGRKLRITTVGGTVGLRASLLVAQQITPVLDPLGPLLGNLKGATGDGQVTLETLLGQDVSALAPLLKSLGSVIAQLDPDKLEELCLIFGKVTEVLRPARNGKPERWPQLVSATGDKTVLDSEFSGDVQGLLKWLVVSSGWCCGRFLGASGNTSGPDDTEPEPAGE